MELLESRISTLFHSRLLDTPNLRGRQGAYQKREIQRG